MEIYSGFAEVYDDLMEHVDYDSWVNYIYKIFEKFNIEPKLLLELGCGTGNITGRLAENNIEVIGIDISEEMLSVAREKSIEEELDILYLCQDMREFELYGTVDVILSICDSINYLTEEEDLLKVFKLVNNYLEPKGYFIFDLNTEHKFKNILGDNVFGESDDNYAYMWENRYYEDEKINEYRVNIFTEDEDGKYDRVEEIHHEKAYSVEKIKELIEESGMEFVASYDSFTFDSVKENSERIYIIAREKGK